MSDKELYDFLEMLDRLTLEQKKDFLAFLRALQAQEQEQQHSASADTQHTSAHTTTATDAAPDNLSREPRP